jgi:hypothetical protein
VSENRPLENFAHKGQRNLTLLNFVNQLRERNLVLGEFLNSNDVKKTGFIKFFTTKFNPHLTPLFLSRLLPFEFTICQPGDGFDEVEGRNFTVGQLSVKN